MEVFLLTTLFHSVFTDERIESENTDLTTRKTDKSMLYFQQTLDINVKKSSLETHL